MSLEKKMIRALRKCSKEHENRVFGVGEIVIPALCRDVADYLEKREWSLPDKGELPPSDDRVLCCTQTKSGQKNIVIGYYMDGMWRCGMNSNVIAWQPLPEPPEVEE